MKRPWVMFFGSAAVTVAVWVGLWPERPVPEKPAVVSVPKAEPWKKNRLGADEEALRAATTPEAKFMAASRLAEIPIDEIPAALDSIKVTDRGSLTLAGKTLLIRWASKDGRAAAEWAWERLRKDRGWDAAFREIGPSWAWHDPAGLVVWAKEASSRMPPTSLDGVRDREIIQSSEVPILESMGITNVAKWVAPLEPLLAFEIIVGRQGWSSEDAKIAASLQSAAQVREALLAFDRVEQFNPLKMSGNEITVSSLLRRWQELDREDFEKSPYGKLLQSVSLGPDPKLMTDGFKSGPPEARGPEAGRLIAGTQEAQREYVTGRIAKEWAEVDAPGALRWADSLADDAARASGYQNAFTRAPDEAVSRIAKLPPALSRTSMVRAFDFWESESAGADPQMAKWPESQRRLWSDLRALAGGD